MPSIPNGRDVTGKIGDKKVPSSPHNRETPNAKPPRPENGRAYAAAKPQGNNYSAREGELKAHSSALRTDAATGKKY
jgi:hypothetical protein